MMTGHVEPSPLAASSPVCIQGGNNKAGDKDQGAAATATTPSKTTNSYILTREASPLLTPTTSTPGMGTAATATTITAAATSSSSSTPKQQPPRKRRRIVISCTECHRRKQKCDRNLPCANCVSRNKQDACRYETAAPTARAAAAAQQQQQQTQQSQQQRFRNSDSDSPRSAEARGDAESREQQRRRPSKYDLDPRLASSVQGDFMSRGSLDSAVSVSDGGGGGGGGGDAHGAGSPVKPPTSFGYAGASSASTLGFLKKLDDGSAPEDALANFAMARENTAYFGTRERYKSLVRQLPARPYIEKLVEIYFKDFHWQYNAFDRYMFDRQMEEWYALPFNALNCEGPQALSPDLRAFPALVFQVIATSLVMLGTDSDPTFESLKYNTSMTFEDLANDYTESGVALLSLLGKRQISLTFVAADWVRAGFLKYSGLVTESWHAIGAAIRDAQECGLHRESLDPRPKSTRLEDVLENQWEKQRRRSMWCVLVVWDVHTGIVLGRPLSVDYSVEYPLPIDAPEPKDPSRTPVVQRSEGDPPNMMTRMLYAHRITMTLKEITDLEKEGPCPKDFSKVDRLHEKLIELDAQTPAAFRRENPDTRYDNLPGCSWIPKARMALHPLVAFNFMALHRPYVFTRPHSRREALKASLKMLELQKASFSSLNPRFYKLYHLFFGTFDAIVLMASIFILFPKENDEYVASALQHFQWAMERFDIMSTRNRLAAAARGVLQAIHLRLKRALGFNGPASIGTTPGPCASAVSQAATCSTTGGESHNGSGSGSGTAITGTSPSVTATSGSGSSSSNTENYSMSSTLTTPGAETTSSSFISEYHLPTLTHNRGGAQTQTHPHSHPLSMATGLGGSGSGGGGGLAANEWSLPDDFDWASIQPVHAMADIAYNDLMGISNSGNGNGTAAVTTTIPMPMPNWAGGTPLLNEAPTNIPDGSGGGAESSSLDTTQEWLFEGDFGNDSVWNLLNQYPAPS